MQKCGLLGRTLKHSYSPAIHAALGGDYRYELFEVEPNDLGIFLETGDFHGLNVTIPYKTAVIPFCKELSPEAAAIGSVNTLLRRPDGSLYGDNTDAMGFRAMLDRSGIDVRGKKALILGSGGSSLTVNYVLQNLGAKEITTISRSGTHTYETLDRHADAQVLVNTTPVGMYPNTGVMSVDVIQFPHLEGVLDIIYNPARTRLMQAAEARGIPCMGGLSMLVGQAAGAAEQFMGRAISDPAAFDNALTLLRRQTENLILIGMPGCGKSTVGRRLAEQLGRPFIDTDREVEQAAGLSIPELFKREGEAGFRARETAVMEQWGKESGLVIATGGGVVTRAENYPHLHQNGRIFFLERPLSYLARKDRPLSQGDLSEMYKRRLPQYRQFADRIIANKKRAKAAADQIVEVFYEILSD